MKKSKQTDVDFGMTRPAMTPEADENRLIALATAVAEQQMRDGTASPSVIVHYLKLGTERERIEKEILQRQKDLITAKTEALKSQKRVEELYADAMTAFKSYSGETVSEDDDYGDD